MPSQHSTDHFVAALGAALEQGEPIGGGAADPWVSAQRRRPLELEAYPGRCSVPRFGPTVATVFPYRRRTAAATWA